MKTRIFAYPEWHCPQPWGAYGVCDNVLDWDDASMWCDQCGATFDLPENFNPDMGARLDMEESNE